MLFLVQATHDEAIQSRVHLKLMSESEEQTQALEEFKLRRKKERTKLGEFLVPHPLLYNNCRVCVRVQSTRWSRSCRTTGRRCRN